MKLTVLIPFTFAIVNTGPTLALPSNSLNPHQAQTLQPYQSSCVPCICPPRLESRYKRSHPNGEVSVSPGDSLQQPRSSDTNSSRYHQDDAQSVQWWPPSLETVLTAIFRAIVTILSLLNVNFTWRIHGQRAKTRSMREITANVRSRSPCRA